MRIGMLIAGFILLFNPVIQTVDILPDCIGFFLIVSAITKPAYFTARIDRARSIYFKLAIVEVIKVFAIILQARVPDTETTFPLLLATVFGIVELIAFIPATNNLFDGLSDCTNGQDGYVASMTKVVNRYVTRKNEQGQNAEMLVKTQEKSIANSVKRFVIFFYVFRVCATIAPELTELEMYNYIGEVHALKRSWASYKGVFQVLLALIVLVIGIVYIVKVARFFRRIKKEGVLNEIINSRFETEILPRTTLFMAKRMKKVMIFFGLSTITSFVLTFENVNILNGAVSAILLIVAASILAKYDKYAWVSAVLAGMRGILAIINFINQIKYFDEYDFSAIFWVEDARKWYYELASIESMEFAFALLAAVAFMIIFMRVIKEHIALCGMNVETAQYSKKSKDAETYKGLKGKLIGVIILAAINYIMSAAYWYLMPTYEATGAIGSLIGIIYIAYTIYALNNVDDNVYDNEISIA